MFFIKDRKNVLKSLFLITLFLLMGVLINVSLISIATFFHLQLGHRFIDIQDWVYANGWFLHIIKSVFSFFIIEKILSIVSYEKNGLSKVFQDFKLDITYKIPALIIIILIISSLISFSPVRSITQDIRLGRLLLSYLGHMTFFFTHTLFIILLFNKVKLKRVSKVLVSLIYVYLVYMTEQVFFKFQENQERLSIFFIFLLIYLCCISKKQHLNLAFFLITFFLCPFLVLFGLDLVWISEFSPFILRSSFGLADIIYLSGAVYFFLFLAEKSTADKV